VTPRFGARAGELLKPVLGRLTPLIQPLLQGGFEAAGGQAADILRDPAKLEELWANEQARGDLVRLFVLGTRTNAVPWDNFTPNLKNRCSNTWG
jgi:hypothetical protein